MAEDGERSVWGIISRACSYVHLLSTRSEQYGTDVNFRKIPCIQGWYCSAEIVNSGKSPVLKADFVRHRCRFPDFPLYSKPDLFGTDVNFRKCPCTQSRICSAQMPISGFTPVRRPILYGTKSNFWNGYRTDGVICSAQIMVCEIPTV